MVHLDLKPDNIVFTKEGKLSLIDFGMAEQINEGGFSDNNKMTPIYRAPEVGSIDPSNPVSYDGVLADVFGIGVLLFIIMMVAAPFD